MEQVRVEPGVHDQRHDGHAVLLGKLEHAAIGLAPNHTVFVDLVRLRRDDRDMVDVPLQALEAPELVHVVEQPLAPRLCEQRRGPGQRVAERERREAGGYDGPCH